MHERIKALRKALGLNQTQFAERLGLSRGFIAQVEIQDRVMSDRTISDIVREFGADEKWLRTGEGEMFAPQTQEEELAAVVGKLLRADNPEWYKRQLILAISDMKTETILDAIEQIKKRFADQ